MNPQLVMPAETQTPRVLAETVADRLISDPSSFDPSDLDTIQEGFCTGRYAGFLEIFQEAAQPEHKNILLSEYNRVHALKPCQTCSASIQRRYA